VIFLKITTELAMPIVHQLMLFLNSNINIMDEKGVIVASGDLNRLYQKHDGAVHVISTKKELIITEENSKLYKGSKPGVNLPIEFNDEIVGVVGLTGNPEGIYKFAKIIKMTVEVLLQQIFLKNQIQYQQKAMEGFLLDLINPYELKEEKLITTSQILNIDLNVERFAFVIKIEEISYFYKKLFKDNDQLIRIDEIKAKIINVINSTVKDKLIYTFLENGYLFLLTHLKNGNEREVAKKIQADVEKLGYQVQIGIGNRNHGLDGYRNSYFQAIQSLKFMRKLKIIEKITHSDDWKLEKLIDGIPKSIRTEFLHPYIEGLNHLNEDYINTLETWIATNLDIKKTSEKLHIHRNTLLYRLKKITETLGLDYQDFEELLILKLILVIRKLDN